MIKVFTNAGIAIKSIRKMAKELDRKSDVAVQKVTAKIATHIKARTLRGRDKNGKKFAEYSKKTIEMKKKSGGRFFTGQVNLFQTGKMMSSMQHKRISSKIGIVGFTREEEAKKALANVKGSKSKGRPKRNFFGISKREKQRFIKDYVKLLKL